MQREIDKSRRRSQTDGSCFFDGKTVVLSFPLRYNENQKVKTKRSERIEKLE